jgi:hypothetical protein
MVLNHILPSIQPQSFLEWTRTSFEQSVKEFYIILLEEHLQVALEMLEVSVKTSPRQRIHGQQLKNFWTRRFLYGPCCIKEKWVIISSQNFLFCVEPFCCCSVPSAGGKGLYRRIKFLEV